MKKYAVSVIVPVYNVEKYIKECLESLVNQTLKNIEIIVVNDGSPDNSQIIIDEYAKKYPDKIKSYIKKNGGVSDARNYGLKKENGEYVAFIDSDDFVDVTMFEKMYNNAKKTKSKVVVCNLIKYSEVNNKYLPNNFIKKNQVIDLTNKDELNYINKCRAFVWNKIYEKKLFENFEFPKGQIFEDSAIIYNVLFEAKQISLINENLYYYRINREGTITTTINNKIFDIFKSCDSIINYHKKNNTFEQYYKKIENLCLVHIFKRMEFFNLSKSYKLQVNYVNTAFDYLNKNFPNWKTSSFFNKTKSLKKNINKIIMVNKFLLFLKIYCPKFIRKFARLVIKIKLNVSKLRLKKVFGKNKKYVIKNERLREIQMIELDILKEIDRICHENKIKYFLIEGSLLGAVRHNGFIPWDDDLDIGMLRNDYDKFLKIAEENLKIGYKLCCYENIKNYHLPFSKIVSLNNRGFKNKEAILSKNYNGPFVDIFPLDTSSIGLGKYQINKFNKIRKYRDILLIKVRYKIKFSWKRLLYFIESPFYSNKKLHEKINKLSTKDNKKNKKYVINYSSSYGVKKEIFPSCCFEEGISIKFEDMIVTIPKNYNYVLTRIYGDYMQLPPENKRISRHSICDMSFNSKNIEEDDIDENN